MREKRKFMRGITLIALVVTIVVLLILAGVSISMLTGENGIIKQASNAKNKTTIAKEKEQVEIAYSAADINKLGEYVTATELQAELDKVAITDVSDNGDKTLNVLFSDTKHNYNVNKGNIVKVEDGENGKENIDWKTILADANANPEKYKHSEQESDEYIGIGTNGMAVNMDLWICQYSFAGNTGGNISPENGYALFNGYREEGMWYVNDRAYLGTDFTNIIIPQYIKGTSDTEFISVTSLTSTFFNCTELVIAPELPSTIIYLDGDDNGKGTFYHCTSLTQAPEIPSSVTIMNNTFENCTSLTEVLEIPNGVTNMWQTFLGCTSLTRAPVIPSSVTHIGCAFENCTSLTQAPEIPSSVTSMYSTFSGCNSLIQAPEIPSSVTDMLATFSGCSSLTQAPEIPSSVTNMARAFENCTSLTGAVIINANPTLYESCFKGTTKAITLTGTSTMLSNLAESADNGNVTY